MEQKLQEFTLLIQNQVGIQENAEIRQQSEATLKQFSQQNPNEFVTLLLLVLRNNDTQYRQFAASQIRKNLSTFSEKNYVNLWPNLNQETQAKVKIDLFQVLEVEQSQNIRHLICDAIGEIGGSLLESTSDGNFESKWPELIGILWQCFQTDKIVIQECGFRIMSNLITFTSKVFKKFHNELYTLFANGIVNSDKNLKVSAIQALGTFVTSEEYKNLKKFENLAQSLIDQTCQVLGQDEELGQDALEVLVDIAENEPKFLKKVFDHLTQQMFLLCQQKGIEDNGIKRMATEILILIGERIPLLLKKNAQNLKTLIELIFQHMIDIDEDITDEWKSPKEGFNEDIEDDDDFEATRFGMNAFDKIISSVGDKEILPQLNQTVQTLMAHQDWRYRFAAIMALSQVGEYIDDVDSIVPIVQQILQFITSDNCKLRYAVLHAIGQISDDMKPTFQARFSSEIIEMCLRVAEDQVPRVASHALACLTNFLEGCGPKEIQPYLKQILLKTFEKINTKQISLMKENSLNCISSLVECAKDDFIPYFQECLPQLFQCYQNNNESVYKILRGASIECITVIADVVGREKYMPYINDTLNLLLSASSEQISAHDPQKKYIMNGWTRLCDSYDQEIKNVLPQIMPPLLRLIKVVLEETDDTQEGEEGGSTNNETEAEVGIQLLEQFIEKMGENFINWVEDTTNIITPLCGYTKNETIRDAAAKLLPGLVKCVKHQKQAAAQLVRKFLVILYNAATSEYTPEVITVQIKSMAECIDEVGQFLTLQELNDFSEKTIKLLIQSDERKKKTQEEANEDEDEDNEDEKEMYEFDKDLEEELHIAIAELIGILFKTHKQDCDQLAALIYEKFLPSVMKDTVSDKMHKFGIFLIDDMVEHLGYEKQSHNWPHLVEALLKFSQVESCAVRQASVYGLGMFAIKTPSEVFPQYLNTVLQALKSSLEIQKKDSSKDSEFGWARDNSVASIGKIIKTHAQLLDLVPTVNYWLSFLPLKHDKPEALEQHEFLINLCLNKSDVIFAHQNNFVKVFQILLDIVDSKVLELQQKSTVIQLLKQLHQQPFVQQNWQNILSNLDETQQKKLQSLQ